MIINYCGNCQSRTRVELIGTKYVCTCINDACMNYQKTVNKIDQKSVDTEPILRPNEIRKAMPIGTPKPYIRDISNPHKKQHKLETQTNATEYPSTTTKGTTTSPEE